MSIPNDTNPSKAETRQRILEAASHTFKALGYARTTTQAIAAEAGVAEVTLFRHFGSKQKLFQAVVQQFGVPAALTRIAGQLTGDYHADLLFIGHHILPILVEQRETTRLLMFEAAHFPQVHEIVGQTPRELRQMLSSYFQQQMERGQVQSLNPKVMAQAFSSMLFGYAIGLDTLTEPLSPEVLLDEIVTQFIHIFVRGTAVSRR